jgi:hypothetical protein
LEAAVNLPVSPSHDHAAAAGAKQNGAASAIGVGAVFAAKPADGGPEWGTEEAGSGPAWETVPDRQALTQGIMRVVGVTDNDIIDRVVGLLHIPAGDLEGELDTASVIEGHLRTADPADLQAVKAYLERAGCRFDRP